MTKHWQYAKYLFRHKWFVFVAGRKMGVSLWRLLIHDWSKFTPAEWSPYVEYFYGAKPKLQKGEPDDCIYWQLVQPYLDAFDRAWLHHQHHNPHHWQYWVLREDSGAVKIVPMPLKFVREMVADWKGAGRAITGRWEVAEWYEKNKGKILLNDETRQIVEGMLSWEKLPVTA